MPTLVYFSIGLGIFYGKIEALLLRDRVIMAERYVGASCRMNSDFLVLFARSRGNGRMHGKGRLTHPLITATHAYLHKAKRGSAANLDRIKISVRTN